MSVNDDPNEFMKNPIYLKHKEFGDFTAFYATITVCTIFGFALFILNIFFCWCSKHRDYWQDSNTGNRWVLPIWTKTPYRQPPLDLTELENTIAKRPAYEVYGTGEEEDLGTVSQGRRADTPGSREYLELQKRESDL
uniref:Uncharacterized protein n=1 Tax=Panstrongylus megistus TaxID=65343 RepID=A0A069DP63_9HEMI